MVLLDKKAAKEAVRQILVLLLAVISFRDLPDVFIKTRRAWDEVACLASHYCVLLEDLAGDERGVKHGSACDGEEESGRNCDLHFLLWVLW